MQKNKLGHTEYFLVLVPGPWAVIGYTLELLPGNELIFSRAHQPLKWFFVHKGNLHTCAVAPYSLSLEVDSSQDRSHLPIVLKMTGSWQSLLARALESGARITVPQQKSLWQWLTKGEEQPFKDLLDCLLLFAFAEEEARARAKVAMQKGKPCTDDTLQSHTDDLLESVLKCMRQGPDNASDP